jgi:hypothetical protein
MFFSTAFVRPPLFLFQNTGLFILGKRDNGLAAQPVSQRQGLFSDGLVVPFAFTQEPPTSMKGRRVKRRVDGRSTCVCEDLFDASTPTSNFIEDPLLLRGEVS